jgi:hypothetical protein
VKSATLNNRKRNDGCEIEEKLLSLTIDVLRNPGVQGSLNRRCMEGFECPRAMDAGGVECQILL